MRVIVSMLLFVPLLFDICSCNKAPKTNYNQVDSIVGIYVGYFNDSTGGTGFQFQNHYRDTTFLDSLIVTNMVTKTSDDSCNWTLTYSAGYGVGFRYKGSNKFVYYWGLLPNYYSPDTMSIQFYPEKDMVSYDHYYFDPGGAGAGTIHETFSGKKIR